MEANKLNIETRLDNIESLLKSQSLNTKQVLTVDEVVLYTGISKQYLYKLTSRKEIPYYQPQGKKLYFNREEIDQWLMRNRASTIEENITEAANSIILHNK